MAVCSARDIVLGGWGAKVMCQFFIGQGKGTMADDMEPLPDTIKGGLTYPHSVGGMEPMTRDQMLGMCEAVIESQKRREAQLIIRGIYQGARGAASRGEKKYTHIQQWVIGRASTVAGQQNITFDSVRDYIMTELGRLFPGCKVEYVERRPDDIFEPLDRRRRHVSSPHSDGVDRAIVVDWS